MTEWNGPFLSSKMNQLFREGREGLDWNILTKMGEDEVGAKGNGTRVESMPQTRRLTTEARKVDDTNP